MTAVGAQLRALRDRCGYSLEQIKTISGGKWHPAAVGAWERGQRNGGILTVAEYVDDLYGVRPVFVPADVTEEQLGSALRILAAGVDPDEFAAALAIARLLKGRAGAVVDGWQVPAGRLREVA